MTKKRRLICCMLVFLITIGLWTPGCTKAAGTKPEEILQSMTTVEKLAQMMVICPSYYQKSDGTKEGVTVLPDELADYLEANHFGGVILMASNTMGTEQTVRLIDSMQVKTAAGGAKAQLFVSIDQEGGSVARLNECVQGPGNMALTATGREEDVTTMASIITKEVLALGFNVNFCPDSDVNNNAANPIIGIRSFSDDPDVVTKFSKQTMSVMQEAGLIACPKHFPGHGNTNVDSHSGLPRIDATYEELQNMELIPFREEIANGVEMLMTAHIEYPMIEKETYTSKSTGKEIFLPATLSKTIITDILRGDMGFEGVVVTDAMNMAAIAEHFDQMDAIQLAINAGVDIFLMPADITTQKGRTMLAAGIQALAGKVDADAELMEKVDAAVLRILKLKEKHGLLTPYDGSDVEQKVEQAMKTVSTKADHDIEWDITKRSITLVKNDDNTLPLTDEGEKTVILTAYNDEPLPMEYIVDLLKEEGKLPENSEYEVHCFYQKEAPEKRQEVLDWIEGADNVIAISEMTSAGFLTGNTAGLIDELIEKTHKQGGRFIVMSVFLPYDAARFQAADAIVLTYGARSMNLDPRQDKEPMKRYGPNMAAGLYMMLEGEEAPSGVLPVNLPKLNEEGDGYSSEILYARGTGLTYEKPEPEKTYENEWVDGKWYGRDGKQTYKPVGSWKENRKGKWFGDTSGWYAKNRWQKIDGKWYYFNKEGYMEKNAYRSGCFLTAGGAWDEKPAAPGWKQDKKGWWYSISGKSYLKDCWKMIDGKWYYFHKNGYTAQGEFVDGWWCDPNGICHYKYRCTWRKSRNGWWYGDASGWYAKGRSYIISGTRYYFNTKGYCTNP